MATNIDNQKLDELAKQALSSFEPESADTEWGAIEASLKASGHTNNFDVKDKIFTGIKTAAESGFLARLLSPYLFIIIIILVAASYLVYHIVNSSKTDSKIETPILTTADSSVMHKDTTRTTIAKTDSEVHTPDTALKALIKDTITIAKVIPKEKVETKTLETSDKKEDIKTDKKEEKELLSKKEKEREKEREREREKQKENDRELKKKAEEKKRAEEKKKIEEKKKTEEKKKPEEKIKKSDNAVGLGGFMLRALNTDSLRKLQNQNANQTQAPSPQSPTPPLKDTLKGK